MHVGLNKPEYNLSNLDIAKSWPKWNKFDTTRQASNPLNPVYKLAHVEYVKPDPPKFIRDSMNVSDLDGARPKQERVLNTRETNKIHDIEGASPKVKKHRKMFETYSNINYNDVTDKLRKSARITDLMNPSYTLRDTMTGDFTRAKCGPVNRSYGEILG